MVGAIKYWRSAILILVMCITVSKSYCQISVAQKKIISDYREKKIIALLCTANDTLNIAYFEDSIQYIKCALYLSTDISLIDSIRQPSNFKQLLSFFKSAPEVLIINDERINLAYTPKDYKILLPTSIASFSFDNKKYLLIKSNLVSSMTGNYWHSILLEINDKGGVVHQYGKETNGEINNKQLKQLITSGI